MNKHITALVVIVLTIPVIFIGFHVFTANSSDEGSQIGCTLEAKLCPDGSSVGRTGLQCEFAPCPEETTPAMTEREARTIAVQTCIKGGGTLSSDPEHNEATKTWWYDANLNATREGCNPACVVSEETRTAEINWRCTGLQPDSQLLEE